MWSLFVWCTESVSAPTIKGAKVVDSSASPRVTGAGYPFDFRTEILIDCYAPIEPESGQFLRELGVWLRTLPGDWSVVTENWEPIASKIGGRIKVAPDLEALGLSHLRPRPIAARSRWSGAGPCKPSRSRSAPGVHEAPGSAGQPHLRAGEAAVCVKATERASPPPAASGRAAGRSHAPRRRRARQQDQEAGCSRSTTRAPRSSWRSGGELLDPAAGAKAWLDTEDGSLLAVKRAVFTRAPG
jgi:hypothetical protein